MGFLPRPIDLVNRSVGLAGVSVARGLSYGGNPRQVLDIYAPAAAAVKRPVIVFFYGGSWQRGARADYAFVAALLAAKGFVTVVPDVRLYPETRFPGFVEDAAAAVAWVMAHVGAFGGDERAVFVLGHSAGAYNAVMLALAAEAPAVAGVIGLAGPYDFLPFEDKTLTAIFAGPSDIRETQPVTHAHGAAPPMFLATGAVDRVVAPRNTAVLAETLRRRGGVVEARIYPRLGHTGLLLALLPWSAWRAPVLRDVLAFIAACRAGAFEAWPHSEFFVPVVRRLP